MGYYDDCLEHHGILGQKWGVRRFESVSGHLTAAGKNRYNQINGEYQKLKKKVMPSKVESAGEKKKENTTEPEKKGLTDKQKKMIIAGAAVVGTAVTAYGGYKLYQHVQTTKKEAHDLLIERGNQATMKALQAEHAKEMSAVRDYVEAKNSRDGHHTNNGGLLVDPEAYKNHWVGVSQRNKAEINKVHADYMKKAENISSSYSKSKQYLKATKNNKEGDIANREWYLNSYDISRFTKNKSSKNSKLDSQKAVESVQQKYKKDADTKATNKLAAEASALAKAVVAEGPKSFSKPVQNQRQTSQSKPKSSPSVATPVTNVMSKGNKSVSNTIKVSGQTKFNQAAKANDDFVNDLLKKNAKLVSGF